MKKEIVTVSVDYEIQYENHKGREDTLKMLVKEMPIRVDGCGVDVGSYSITRLIETAKIIDGRKN